MILINNESIVNKSSHSSKIIKQNRLCKNYSQNASESFYKEKIEKNNKNLLENNDYDKISY